MFWLSKLVQLTFAGILLFLSLKLRTPLVANFRTELLWTLPIGLVSLWLLNIVRTWQCRTGPYRSYRWMHLLLIFLCTVGLTVLGLTEREYRFVKQTVLNGDRVQLERLGQHLVVGYRNFEEVQTLVQNGGIGGIFITRHNLDGQTIEQLQQEISTLQAIRKEQQLPPLWVATDQEGGIVSRLSPPLTQLPPLAEVVSQASSPEAQQQEIQNLKKQLKATDEKAEAVTEVVESSSRGISGGGSGGSWFDKTSIGGYGELHYNGGDKDEIDFHRFVAFINHEFSDSIRLFSEI